MYKLATSNKMGHKGKRVTDENVNSYPDALKATWEKAGLIKKTNVKPKNKE